MKERVGDGKLIIISKGTSTSVVYGEAWEIIPQTLIMDNILP